MVNRSRRNENKPNTQKRELTRRKASTHDPRGTMAKRKQSKKSKVPAKRGRPSAYRKEYDEQARKLCMLGYTDKQLGDFFGVSEQTINSWKKKFPEFLVSLKKGKELADAEVVESLYRRAVGYSHDEEKLFQYEGYVIRADTVKHYPPDPTAMIFWLKNRQPAKFRDKPDAGGDDEDPLPVKIEVLVKDASKAPNAVA